MGMKGRRRRRGAGARTRRAAGRTEGSEGIRVKWNTATGEETRRRNTMHSQFRKMTVSVVVYHGTINSRVTRRHPLRKKPVVIVRVVCHCFVCLLCLLYASVLGGVDGWWRPMPSAITHIRFIFQQCRDFPRPVRLVCVRRWLLDEARFRKHQINNATPLELELPLPRRSPLRLLHVLLWTTRSLDHR